MNAAAVLYNTLRNQNVLQSPVYLKDYVVESYSYALPLTGVGTLRMHQEELVQVLQKGLHLIDTAKAYENENMVGAALKEYGHKDAVTVITKLFRSNLESKEALYGAIEDSITKLGKIPEFFLIHGPYPDIAILALVHELENMKAVGIIKQWGVSNFDVEHLTVLIGHGYKPILNQVEYHPFFQRPVLRDYCFDHDILMQAYRPIAQGAVLTNECIISYAFEFDITPAQLVYAWLAQQQIALVTKTSSPDHQQEYAESKIVSLSSSIMDGIAKLNRGKLGRTCTKGGWFVPFTQEIKSMWCSPALIQ